MKIVVCLPGSNFSSKFLMSLWDLQDGCRKNGIELIPSPAQSCNIYMVRSMCLGADMSRGIHQKPFNGKLKYDALLWIDSDMIFTYRNLAKLIAHDKDIVGAHYAWEGGKGLTCAKWDMNFFKRHFYMPHFTVESLRNAPRVDGLVEVDYTGFGFLLIKYGVFEAMDYPWFKPHYTTIEMMGLTIKDFSMEDVGFCLDVKEKGYKIWVDPELKCGHEKKAVY